MTICADTYMCECLWERGQRSRGSGCASIGRCKATGCAAAGDLPRPARWNSRRTTQPEVAQPHPPPGTRGCSCQECCPPTSKRQMRAEDTCRPSLSGTGCIINAGAYACCSFFFCHPSLLCGTPPLLISYPTQTSAEA